MSESIATLLERENLPEFQIKIPERIHKLQPILSEAKKNLVTTSTYNGLATAGRQNLHLHVSKNNIDRAIKILSTILTAFEKRGFKFSTQNQHGNYIYFPTVTIQGTAVRFRLQERMKKTVVKSLDQVEKSFRNLIYSFKPGESYLLPSGQLYLQIESDSDLQCRKLWEDKEKEPIEDQLNSFMKGLITTSEGVRIREERWLAADRERQALAEIAYKKEHQRRAKEERINAVKSLVGKVEEYEKILLLKNSLQNPTNFQGLEKEVTQFLLWVDEYLESGDPVTKFLKTTVRPLIEVTPSTS